MAKKPEAVDQWPKKQLLLHCAYLEHTGHFFFLSDLGSHNVWFSFPPLPPKKDNFCTVAKCQSFYKKIILMDEYKKCDIWNVVILYEGTFL